MSLFVLDTDVLTLYYRGDPIVTLQMPLCVWRNGASFPIRNRGTVSFQPRGRIGKLTVGLAWKALPR